MNLNKIRVEEDDVVEPGDEENVVNHKMFK